jgi:hypothetical protein
MKPLSLYLCERLLPRLLVRKCPDRISRSGEGGKKVNCFVVEIYNAETPGFLVNGMDGNTLQCSQFNGRSYALPATVDLSTVELRGLRITHYYGLAQIDYRGIYDFVLMRYSGLPYASVWAQQRFDELAQTRFNRKSLVAARRMQVLRVLVDCHPEGPLSSDELITRIYSMRFWLHPDYEAKQSMFELYLNSLVRSGDVEARDYNYIVTGQALRTLEEYEENELRHRQGLRVQIAIAVLTLILALLTLVQADLIKLPLLIDWSH